MAVSAVDTSTAFATAFGLGLPSAQCSQCWSYSTKALHCIFQNGDKVLCFGCVHGAVKHIENQRPENVQDPLVCIVHVWYTSPKEAHVERIDASDVIGFLNRLDRANDVVMDLTAD